MMKRKLRSVERKLKTMGNNMEKEREVLKLFALLDERLDLENAPIKPDTRRQLEFYTLGDILLKSRWLTSHTNLRGIGDKKFQEVRNVVENAEEYKRVTRWVDDNLK